MLWWAVRLKLGNFWVSSSVMKGKINVESRTLMRKFPLIMLVMLLTGCSATQPTVMPTSITLPDRSAEMCAQRPIRLNQPQGDSGNAEYLLPTTFEELVQRNDLIVIGTIGDLIQQRTFNGYNQAGEPIWSNEQSALPIWDYAINVQQIITSTHAISDTPILRHFGAVVDGIQRDPRYINAPLSHDLTYMMVLTRNPDKKTYGFYSLSARLFIADDLLHFSDGAATPLLFNGQPVSTATFISCLRMVNEP